jgi:hypothetical protein
MSCQEIGRDRRYSHGRFLLAAFDRVPPQGVDEDPNRAAGGAHVIELTACQPIVDGSATYAYELSRLHDRDGLSFQAVLPSSEGYRTKPICAVESALES